MKMKKYIAEFIGTAVLVIMGCGTAMLVGTDSVNGSGYLLTALAFGLGTWPVLLATGLAAERITTLLRKRGVRMAGGLLVILFGIWTLPGPHQHWLMGH